MNKEDLIAHVAERSGVSKSNVKTIVDSTFNAITTALKQGDRVQLVGFGTFNVRKRAARKGRNPKTKEPMNIAAKTVPTFRAGTALKTAVSGKRR